MKMRSLQATVRDQSIMIDKLAYEIHRLREEVLRSLGSYDSRRMEHERQSREIERRIRQATPFLP
jgi:hypothetical protein